MYFIFEIPIIYILIIIAMILGLVFAGFVGLVYWIQAHLTAIITVIGIINAIFFIVSIIISWEKKDTLKDTLENMADALIFSLIACVILDLPLYLIYRILMWIADMLGMF